MLLPMSWHDDMCQFYMTKYDQVVSPTGHSWIILPMETMARKKCTMTWSHLQSAPRNNIHAIGKQQEQQQPSIADGLETLKVSGNWTQSPAQVKNVCHPSTGWKWAPQFFWFAWLLLNSIESRSRFDKKWKERDDVDQPSFKAIFFFHNISMWLDTACWAHCVNGGGSKKGGSKK